VSSLWRVQWEIDVEADSPEQACINARDAFSVEQSSGTFHVVEFKGDDLGDVQEVAPPPELIGPHPLGVIGRCSPLVAFSPAS
jgi:hypothetical protein